MPYELFFSRNIFEVFSLQNLASWNLFQKLLNASGKCYIEAVMILNPLATSSDVSETE